jgi:hypothetical protein
VFWRKQPKNEPNAEDGASANNADYRWDDSQWRVPPYKHWEAGNSDYQTDERNFWWHQVWALWASVGISIVTLIGAIIAGTIAYSAFVEARRQANAAVEATRIARGVMLVTQRANLIHGRIELNGFIPIKGSVPENYAEIRVDIINSGHAQAIIKSNGVSYVNAPSEVSPIPDNAPCGPPSSPVLNAPINGTRITEAQATYLIVVPRVLDTQGEPAIPSSHGYVLGFIEYDDGYSLRGDAGPVSEYFCGRFEETDQVAPGRTYHPIRDCSVTCKKD